MTERRAWAEWNLRRRHDDTMHECVLSDRRTDDDEADDTGDESSRTGSSPGDFGDRDR